MGLRVNTVKSIPSGVGVRTLEITQTGGAQGHSWSFMGGFVMGPAQKKHSFSFLPEDHGTHPVHTPHRKGQNLYPIM